MDPNHRSVVVTFRVTEAERQALQAKAEKQAMSISAVIRAAVSKEARK